MNMKSKTKSKFQRISGWLSKEDIEVLEEASKRKLKYAKNPAKKFKCNSCEYIWLYTAVRCPLCSSLETVQIK
jgi:hypothetical protein